MHIYLLIDLIRL